MQKNLNIKNLQSTRMSQGIIIFGTIVLIIAFTVGGYALTNFLKKSKIYGNQKNVLDNIVTSRLNVYKNEEFRIEFKYPSNFVVILQPGSQKNLGKLFIISQADYIRLQNKPIFLENPLLMITQNNTVSGF